MTKEKMISILVKNNYSQYSKSDFDKMSKEEIEEIFKEFEDENTFDSDEKEGWEDINEYHNK